MNLHPPTRHRNRPNPDRSGVLLVECLVYIGLWMVVVGMAFALFYRALTETRALQRCTDDVGRALQVGEWWRADIRRATRPIACQVEEGLPVLRIPAGSTQIEYRCSPTNVVRVVHTAGREIRHVLLAARSARFEEQTAGPVTFWRWELELPARRAAPTVQPRFTFIAVPGGEDSR